MTEGELYFFKNVSRETFEKLKIYETLLLKWQAHINLVSFSTLPILWERHFLDSAQLFPLIKKKGASLVDLGSGAGFPGAILAILGCSNVGLIERDQRKCSFLRTVSRETKTPFIVFEGSIENYKNKADYVTSRALAPLKDLLKLAYPLLQETTVCLFLKGKETEEEIYQAEREWEMTATKKSSTISPEGMIIILENVRKRASHRHCQPKRGGGENNHHY